MPAYERRGFTESEKSEIRIMIVDELRPFHEQNTRKFDMLFTAMNQLSGSIKTASWIIGFIIAIAGIAIGLVEALRR